MLVILVSPKEQVSIDNTLESDNKSKRVKDERATEIEQFRKIEVGFYFYVFLSLSMLLLQS